MHAAAKATTAIWYCAGCLIRHGPAPATIDCEAEKFEIFGKLRTKPITDTITAAAAAAAATATATITTTTTTTITAATAVRKRVLRVGRSAKGAEMRWYNKVPLPSDSKVREQLKHQVLQLMQKPYKQRFNADLVHVDTIPSFYPAVVSLRGEQTVRASKDIPIHSVLAIYEGRILPSDCPKIAAIPKTNTKLLDVEAFGKLFVINASDGHGNGIGEAMNDFRLVVSNLNSNANQIRQPNVVMCPLFFKPHHDLSFPEVAIITNQPILSGQEILVDYSPEYWLAWLKNQNESPTVISSSDEKQPPNHSDDNTTLKGVKHTLNDSAGGMEKLDDATDNEECGLASEPMSVVRSVPAEHCPYGRCRREASCREASCREASCTCPCIECNKPVQDCRCICDVCRKPQCWYWVEFNPIQATTKNLPIGGFAPACAIKASPSGNNLLSILLSHSLLN
jgi:hypothetical protein